jgi:hypothetical protein
MDAGNSVMALLPQESDCKPAVHVRLQDKIENKNTSNILKSIPFPLVWDLCLHASKLALFFLLKTAFFYVSPSSRLLHWAMLGGKAFGDGTIFFVNCIPVVNPYQTEHST